MDAVEAVETTIGRTLAGSQADVPFAGHEGLVASGLQQLRESSAVAVEKALVFGGVKVRGGDFPAVAAEVGEPHVIGHDEEDIRSLGGESGEGDKQSDNGEEA